MTEEETVEMKSEKVIFDEIKDVFDEFWDKQRETPNPRLKLINNFWKKFKFCQILPDPHALNSRKMVGWKVATFKKDEEYFRCSSARSPTEVEVIPFQAREFVSSTLIAANLLNFGSNCVMFGDPKREIASDDMFAILMERLDFPVAAPLENHWKTF